MSRWWKNETAYLQPVPKKSNQIKRLRQRGGLKRVKSRFHFLRPSSLSAARFHLTLLGEFILRRIRSSPLLFKGIDLARRMHSSCSSTSWRLMDTTKDKTTLSIFQIIAGTIKDTCSGSMTMDRNINARKHNINSSRPPVPCHRRKRKRRRQLIARSIGRPKSSRRRQGTMQCLPREHTPIRVAMRRLLPTQPVIFKTSTSKLERSRTPCRHKMAIEGENDGGASSPGPSRQVTSRMSRSDNIISKRQTNRKTKRKKKRGQNLFLEIPDYTRFLTRFDDRTERCKPSRRRARLNKIPTPTPLCPDSSDWPSLVDSSLRKGSIKETAKEMMKNKQGGSVTRLAKKRWADIAASRSKESSGDGTTHDPILSSTEPGTASSMEPRPVTWASVAANMKVKTGEEKTLNYKNGVSNVFNHTSVYETKPEPSNDGVGCLSPVTAGCKRKKKDGSRLLYTNRLWADGIKGKGKPQAIKFYRRHFGDEVLVRGKQKALQSARQKNQKAVKEAALGTALLSQTSASTSREIPNKCSPVFQGTKATSKDTNGQQNWCIDNMPVVYTGPVGKAISLNSKTIATNAIDKCNNRSVSPSKTIQVWNRELNSDACCSASAYKRGAAQSGSDLCTLLSTISVQSTSVERGENDLTESKRNSRDSTFNIKGADQPKSSASPLRRSSRLRRSENITKVGQEECSKQKKISLRYRELIRADNNRLDAKAVREMRMRNKRTDTMQGDKVSIRTQRRRHRQMTHNAQRSPMAVGTTTATSTTTTSTTTTTTTRPSEGHSSCSEGRSSNAMMLPRERSARRAYRKQWHFKDNCGANNSMDAVRADASTAMSGLLYRRCAVQARSAPDLAACRSRMYLDLHPISTDCLDMEWWHAYLQQPTLRSRRSSPPLPEYSLTNIRD